MGEIVGSLWWLIVTLGLLVTFHEFGHFIVARRLGVKVLRFSVGFGKPLAMRRGRDGTEYVVAAIPLGGYVKMLDERESEHELDPAEAKFAFNRKPIASRIAIVAAGPFFNLVFAVFAFWAMFVIGRYDYQPVLGPTTGVAAEAGLKTGDRIESVDGEPVTSYTQVFLYLAERTIAREDATLSMRRTGDEPRTVVLPLSRVPRELDEDHAIDSLGFRVAFLGAPVAEELPKDKPAARAGVLVGDRVTAINGVPVPTYDTFYDVIQAQAARDPALVFTIERDGRPLQLPVTAERSTDEGAKRWIVGFAPTRQARSPDALLQYGPLQAIPAAFGEAWTMTAMTGRLLGHLVFGRADLKNVSGPIGIAQAANSSARAGPGAFLWFLGLLSLSIGILNLLPIPILDGGHLLYYLIELVKGSPVTERTVQMGQALGLALLLCLMGLAFYNDISHIVSRLISS